MGVMGVFVQIIIFVSRLRCSYQHFPDVCVYSRERCKLHSLDYDGEREAICDTTVEKKNTLV